MPMYRPTESWRDWYNPLRGLTLARLLAMEDQADRGEFADLQWFWHHMGRVDIVIQAAKARRLSFIDGLDYQIKQVEGADPVLAAEQQGLLKHAYNRIANFRDATKCLAGAIFDGYAHLEKIRGGLGGIITRLDHIPAWYWCRDGKTGRWKFNKKADSTGKNAEEVDATSLVTLQADPINRALGRQFFAKQLCFADWDTALENGANQNVFFVAPPGQDTPDKMIEFAALANAMISNGRGALQNGTDVKQVDLGQRSRLPYKDRIDYCDKQIVMACTGGLLTMLTESGSGTLAGGAHNDGLMDLAKSDAAMLSEAYQRQIDREIIRKFFPGRPLAAYFEFELPQRTDTAALLSAVSNLSWIGKTVESKWLEEKTGMKIIDMPPQEQPQQ